MRNTIDRLRRTVGPLAARVADRRTRFRDFRCIQPQARLPQSRVLQFYSSVDNIGNYLPVLGIQSMLGEQLDTWCAHDRGVDFSFVNANYKGVIIGGAGLLHASFTPFWRTFLMECRLPTIVWGIGACWHDGDPASAVDPRLLKQVGNRFDLINVRDDPTASRYGWREASITACPTVAFITQTTLRMRTRTDRAILYASHPDLVGPQERDRILASLSGLGKRVLVTDHQQRPLRGIPDILKLYRDAHVVVSSRLHGAIIAYALGIPYVALARDEKIRAFHMRYGRGVCVEDSIHIPSAVATSPRRFDAPRINDCLAVGVDARKWIDAL